jgi:PHP family Zn ribbon phosphoesterase
MTPPAIVARAVSAGLDAIGVSDHNSAESVAAVQEAGRRVGLPVLPGMEVTSREEVHLLVFLDDLEALQDLQEQVYERLPGRNGPEHFGEQLLADADGAPMGTVERLLIGRTEIPLGELVGSARERGALVIASHVDRPSYSLVSQLGFIPAELPLDAVEISARFPAGEDPAELLRAAASDSLPWVRFSDAHALEQIGVLWTLFSVPAASAREVRRALHDREKRSVGP